jgi:hypothetical protein
MTTNIETRVREFANLHNTSVEFLINLAEMDNDIALGPLLDDLEKLCLSVHPIPISLRNPVVIKKLLDDSRKRREEQTRPVPFAVVIVGGGLFSRVLSNGAIETTNSFQHCAAFKDPIVAYKAATLLSRMTQESLRATTITNERRPLDTISNNLADLGFESTAVKQ